MTKRKYTRHRQAGEDDTPFTFAETGSKSPLPPSAQPIAAIQRIRRISAVLDVSSERAAREHGLKVKPLCPFIARYISTHPEWQALVMADFRARLGLPD